MEKRYEENAYVLDFLPTVSQVFVQLDVQVTVRVL